MAERTTARRTLGVEIEIEADESITSGIVASHEHYALYFFEALLANEDVTRDYFLRYPEVARVQFYVDDLIRMDLRRPDDALEKREATTKKIEQRFPHLKGRTESGVEGEAVPAYVKIEGDDDFSEEFLYEFRKHLPKDWDVRVADGRLEVREWADRPEPLFHFDVTRHSPHELIVGLPEIVGAMMTQMHKDFCELRKFTTEAVAGCAAPDELAGPVVVKAKSMPIAWELSEGIEDAFPGVIVRKGKVDEKGV